MIEYYITRQDGRHFQIAKFAGDAQPENIYLILMKRRGEAGYLKPVSGSPVIYTDPQFHCNCPNQRRSKHINDKHGQMVAKWLLAGEKPGYFDDKGEFHEQRDEGADEGQRADFERGVYEREHTDAADESNPKANDGASDGREEDEHR